MLPDLFNSRSMFFEVVSVPLIVLVEFKLPVLLDVVSAVDVLLVAPLSVWLLSCCVSSTNEPLLKPVFFPVCVPFTLLEVVVLFDASLSLVSLLLSVAASVVVLFVLSSPVSEIVSVSVIS